jgi:hypothetical protein
MAKPPKHTDLSAEEGDPTPRGDPVVHLQSFEVEARLKAFALKLTTRTEARSPAGIAVAVLLVTIAGIACVMVMHVVGVPGAAASAGLLLPTAVYGLIVLVGRAIRR